LGILSPKDKNVVYPTWFLVDTGAPYTYLEEKTAGLLYGKVPTSTSFSFAIIGKKDTVVSSLSSGIWKEINLLGTDILWSGFLSIKYPTILSLKFEE